MHLTFHIILHTHWDREWYLTHAAFQARLVPALGDVLALLDRDTNARFVVDGQTILVADAVAVRPEWTPRIAAAVTRGQLEVGPWHVLADEIVPSGESLLRNLLQGARDSTALGGRMDVLYSPDAFGHPAILPTLAREFGIDTAVIWRGLVQSGRHRSRPLPVAWARRLRRSRSTTFRRRDTRSAPISPGPKHLLAERWGVIRSQLVDRAVTSHIAIFVGADHHAPARDPAALRDALQSIEPGHDVRLSSLTEFLRAAVGGDAGASATRGRIEMVVRAHMDACRAPSLHGPDSSAVTLPSSCTCSGSSSRSSRLPRGTGAAISARFFVTPAGHCSHASSTTRCAAAAATRSRASSRLD